jgi:hypothetical protein
MVRVEIKYNGKRTGCLALFFSVFRPFDKFNTIEEAITAFNEWSSCLNLSEWEIKI